jgi:membrane-associated phospholipid phosphatase
MGTGAILTLLAMLPPSWLPDQVPQPDQPPPSISTSAPVDTERDVSWRKLADNVGADQKHIWSFPTRLGHKEDWIPAAIIVGATAAMVASVDHLEAQSLRGTANFSGFNSVLNSSATIGGILAVPFGLYTTGLLRKDRKMQTTALLATEALADSEIVATVLKDITRRQVPSTIPKTGNFSDSWFDNKGSYFSGNGSFPSGHTIAAFSVATIVARRYRNHRWVPYASYGLAGLVAFSRLTLSAHFLSDVFMGGALGYTISRFTVLRE